MQCLKKAVPYSNTDCLILGNIVKNKWSSIAEHVSLV